MWGRLTTFEENNQQEPCGEVPSSYLNQKPKDNMESHLQKIIIIRSENFSECGARPGRSSARWCAAGPQFDFLAFGEPSSVAFPNGPFVFLFVEGPKSPLQKKEDTTIDQMNLEKKEAENGSTS